jgi:hypothetical protein
MAKYLINGEWRADSANETDPQAINGSITISSELDGLSWTAGTATTSNYTSLYWRWDGLRWLYEPQWVWIPDGQVYQYPTYTTTPTYKMIKVFGKTLLYRFIDNEIEYAFVEGTELTFKKANNLDVILNK